MDIESKLNKIKSLLENNEYYLFRIKDNEPKLFLCGHTEKDVKKILQEKINKKPDKYIGQKFIEIDIHFLPNFKNLSFCPGPLKITTMLYEISNKKKIDYNVDDRRYAEFWYSENLVDKFEYKHIKRLAKTTWKTKINYSIVSLLLIEKYIKI